MSASTGAAISGLTGVAATNATLAWLGGGALSAGGFGVAGGMAVLGGLEDVENALTASAAADRRTEQLVIAQEAARNSAILARIQYQSGMTDFQTLLTTEQSLLSASNSLASSRAERALAMVQLYNALGGGWQTMNGNGQ